MKTRTDARSCHANFTVLRSDVDLARWLRKHCTPNHFTDGWRDQVELGLADSRRDCLEKREKELARLRPLRYPCAVIELVTSMCYEETQPYYLYLDDAEELVRKIHRAFDAVNQSKKGTP
jgi:hypothetical protein